MDPPLSKLFHKHIATAFAWQQQLSEFLDQHPAENGEYAISTSELKLGDITLEATCLGSYSEEQNGWLWAWLNPGLGLSPEGLELGTEVQRLGREQGIACFLAKQPFSCAEVLGEELSRFAPHVFASIVVGELGYDAFYILPFQHGWTVAVIRDDRLVGDVPDIPQLAKTFAELVSAIPITDHRAAFRAYLDGYGHTLEESGLVTEVLIPGQPPLVAEFDDANRLTKLSQQGPGKEVSEDDR